MAGRGLTMNRKLNRMIVEDGLRKRAEARREAMREAESTKMMEVINDNAFVAERYAKRLERDKAIRERRSAKRTALKVLWETGTSLLFVLWVNIALAAIATLCYVFEGLPYGTTMLTIFACCIVFAVCVYRLWKNAGKIADLMKGDE